MFSGMLISTIPILPTQLRQLTDALNRPHLVLACMPTLLPADLGSAVLRHLGGQSEEDADYTLEDLSEDLCQFPSDGHSAPTTLSGLNPMLAHYLDQAAAMVPPMSKTELFSTARIRPYLPRLPRLSIDQKDTWGHYAGDEEGQPLPEALSEAVTDANSEAILGCINRLLHAHIAATPDLKSRYERLNGPAPKLEPQCAGVSR